MPNAPDDPADRPLSVLHDDERLLAESVRAFAQEVVQPLVREMDERGAIPRSLIDRLFELGLMGLQAPVELGGGGGRCFHAIIAVEELSRIDPSIGLLVDVQNTLVVNALLRWASPPLRDRLVPKLCRGQIGAYALSESASGSDAFALTTRAVPSGDAFVLDGRKQWVTNAAEAELFLVFATVDPEAGYRGITAFAVERGSPGLTIGRKEDKLGIRASSTCEVLLDGCRVPAAHVVGEVGQGYRVAIETLNEGRIGIGAQMVGLAGGALALAIAHTRERRQFGQPIAAFQGVRFQLARAATELQAARLLVYDAARRRDAGLPFVSESAMAKLYSSEMAERVTSLAVNLHGASGYVKEGRVEKLYRDAKIGQIYEGASNLQLQTIATQILGSPVNP